MVQNVRTYVWVSGSELSPKPFDKKKFRWKFSPSKAKASVARWWDEKIGENGIFAPCLMLWQVWEKTILAMDQNVGWKKYVFIIFYIFKVGNTVKIWLSEKVF